jgi:hypothetical protein
VNWPRASLVCAMLALPASLSGCVAAAIPVLAAGGIVAREDRADPQPDAEQPALVQPPVVEVDPALPAQARPTTAAELSSEEPAPAVPTNPSASAIGTIVVSDSVAAFARHAEEQALRDPVTAPRQSAILATVGSLIPETSDCGIRPPAVLIDLDPAGARYVPNAPLAPAPALVSALADLRLRDIAVHWIAAAPAVEAGRLRAELLATGLDPWGRDALLLMRRAGDSKEARRRELAQTHCVVAILGDSKSDFDELFDYLRNPAAAASLDALLGNGWFLAPPLTSATKD